MALVAATWVYLVVTRLTDWDSVGSSVPALITLGGYVAGALVMLASILPKLPARTIAMIPASLVLNIVIGQVVGSVGIPLYLDSIGTVIVAALAGPMAGLATGTLSSVVWGLLNPSALPFAAVGAALGFLAGIIIRHGGLKNIATAILSGVAVGVVCGMLAAPVAAFVYGGTSGLGTGAIDSLFREMGNSLLASVTFQSFISDPLDKAITMVIAFFVVKALPKKTLRAFDPRIRTRK